MRNLRYLIAVLAAAGLGLLLGQHSRHQEIASGPSRQVLDPKDPAYRAKNPKILPSSGMQRPVFADDSEKPPVTHAWSHSSAGVYIDADARQRFGIRLEPARRVATNGILRLSGRVAVDESRLFRVNVAADGYVKETSDDGVGSYVKKDQRLAVIYAPEFLSIAGGYLSANERTQGVNKESAPVNQGFAGPQTWADRLRNLGMSDSQISELTSIRKIPEVIYINSPADGFVVARNISAGQTFDRYVEFYRIADLSHVWIIADAFGNEGQNFRPGMPARITLPGRGMAFDARLESVLPQVNPSTRTLQLRLETDNKNLVLRPEMVVDVELKGSAPERLSVPADSVVDSGTSRRIFVERGDGSFERREVKTGQWFADRVEILEGLAPGEKVVVSGAFLVDSENRLSNAITAGVSQAENSPETGDVKRASAASKSAKSSFN